MHFFLISHYRAIVPSIVLCYLGYLASNIHHTPLYHLEHLLQNRSPGALVDHLCGPHRIP